MKGGIEKERERYWKGGREKGKRKRGGGRERDIYIYWKRKGE